MVTEFSYFGVRKFFQLGNAEKHCSKTRNQAVFITSDKFDNLLFAKQNDWPVKQVQKRVVVFACLNGRGHLAI